MYINCHTCYVGGTVLDLHDDVIRNIKGYASCPNRIQFSAWANRRIFPCIATLLNRKPDVRLYLNQWPKFPSFATAKSRIKFTIFPEQYPKAWDKKCFSSASRISLTAQDKEDGYSTAKFYGSRFTFVDTPFEKATILGEKMLLCLLCKNSLSSKGSKALTVD